MMALMSMMVFTGAMALALMAIWSTVAPDWRRIVRLAAGQMEQPFQPLGVLTQAERRIAVRHWATASVPAVVRRSRAAA